MIAVWILLAYAVCWLVSVRIIAKLTFVWYSWDHLPWDREDDSASVLLAIIWPVAVPVLAVMVTCSYIGRHLPKGRPLRHLTGIKEKP